MASDISGGVQAMEAEAARVLDEARAKASDIALKAREESRKMAATELPLNDVKAEGAKLVKDAEKQAELELKRADKRAEEIKASAGKRADHYAKKMVSIVLGEKAA
jgi:vacuolar-type H+-ATPase subunit H